MRGELCIQFFSKDGEMKSKKKIIAGKNLGV